MSNENMHKLPAELQQIRDLGRLHDQPMETTYLVEICYQGSVLTEFTSRTPLPTLAVGEVVQINGVDVRVIGCHTSWEHNELDGTPFIYTGVDVEAV